MKHNQSDYKNHATWQHCQRVTVEYRWMGSKMARYRPNAARYRPHKVPTKVLTKLSNYSIDGYMQIESITHTRHSDVIASFKFIHSHSAVSHSISIEWDHHIDISHNNSLIFNC